MRRLITLFLGIAGVAIVGCSTNDSGTLALAPTDSVVTGTYILQLANGNPVPFAAFQTATDLWAIAGEKIVLSPDLTWSDTTNYQVISLLNGNERDTLSTSAGTYSLGNNQINFLTTSNGTASYVGSVSGNVLDVRFQGSRFVYTRQ